MLFTPTQPARKPGPGAVIDWANQLTLGLRFYTAFQGAPLKTGADVGRTPVKELVGRLTLDSPNPSATSPIVGTPSRTGPSIAFPGGANSFFVKLPDRVGLENISTGGLSVAAKIRFTDATTNKAIVAKGPIVSSSHHYILIASPSGTGDLRFEVRDAGGSVTATTTGTYNDGHWYTVLGAWDGFTVWIIVVDENGLLREATSGGTTAGPLANTGQTIRIGGYNNDPGTNTFIGEMEWLGIWVRALSAADVVQLALAPYQFLNDVRRRFPNAPAIFGSASQFAPPVQIVGGGHLERHRLPPIRDRGRQKPGRGAVINWDDPLARRLQFYLPMNEFLQAGGSTKGIRVNDLVNRVSAIWQPSSATAFTSAPSRTGIGMLQTGTQMTFPYISTLDVHDALGLTIAFKFRLPAAPSVSSAGLLGKDQAGFRHWLFSAINVTGQIQFITGTTNAATTTGNYCDGKWYTAVAFSSSVAAVELRIYDENGFELERVSGAGVPTGVTGGNTSVIDFPSNSASSETEWVGVWRGKLNYPDQRTLAEQPYRFLVPVQSGRALSGLFGNASQFAPPLAIGGTSRYRKIRGQTINWRNPITRDLACFLPFNDLPGKPGDAVRRTVFQDLAGNLQMEPIANGMLLGGISRTGGPSLNFPRIASGDLLSKTSIGGVGAGNLHDILKTMTVMAKVRLDPNPGSTTAIIVTKNQTSTDWILNANGADGSLTWGIGSGGGAQTVTTSGGYDSGGQWITVVGLYTGSRVVIVIFDEFGRELERVTSAGAPTFTDNNNRIAIGGIGAASLYKGDIEWIGIWKRLLPQNEIIHQVNEPYELLQRQVDVKKSVLQVVAVTSTISPSGIASAEAFGTAIVQGAIIPSAIDTGEAFGVDAVIDIATTISPSAIASAEFFGNAELIDGTGAAGTINLDTAHDGIATAEAFGTASVTDVATIYPTGIPSGEDLDNPDVGAPVGTIEPFGIASEEAFADVAATGLGVPISGTSVFELRNPTPPLVGTVTAKKLCSPLDLIRAELYDTAPSPADILPDVYGDFSLGGLRGPVPAVLVTQTSPWVFIAAAHPVKAITNVYIDDVEATSGFITIPAVALGGGPQVAVIAFTDQPNGQVSWRGSGRMDDTGALITNPIRQLYQLLIDRGGYHSEDFDATTLAEAISQSDLTGWATAWVFNDDRQIQDWITEVLFNIMGFWRVSGNAQLQITLDPGGSFDQSALIESIIPARDCIDGDDGVEFVADRTHLVNKLEAFYLYSWSLQQPSSRIITLEDLLSINAYDEIRKSVTLRGLRDNNLLTTWSEILFERQAFRGRVEGATVAFTVKGSKLAHATIGDLIAFSWPYGPTRENGNPYVNEVLRVLTVSQDFARGGATAITAVDTGTFVDDGTGHRLLTPLAL